MIEEGFKIGLGIAAAFAGLWVAGWVLVLLLAFIDEQRSRAQRNER